jgi:hypothetical protein
MKGKIKMKCQEKIICLALFIAITTSVFVFYKNKIKACEPKYSNCIKLEGGFSCKVITERNTIGCNSLENDGWPIDTSPNNLGDGK